MKADESADRAVLCLPGKAPSARSVLTFIGLHGQKRI
jgi:hypothetical protein